MFNNLGWEEVLLLAIIGLIVFGPDRLPGAIKDATRMLRELRNMARGAANDLKSELGPEMADLDLTSLHPRRFVENVIFGDDDVSPGAKAASAVAEQAGPVAVVALAHNERPPYDADAT